MQSTPTGSLSWPLEQALPSCPSATGSSEVVLQPRLLFSAISIDSEQQPQEQPQPVQTSAPKLCSCPPRCFPSISRRRGAGGGHPGVLLSPGTPGSQFGLSEVSHTRGQRRIYGCVQAFLVFWCGRLTLCCWAGGQKRGDNPLSGTSPRVGHCHGRDIPTGGRPPAAHALLHAPSCSCPRFGAAPVAKAPLAFCCWRGISEQAAGRRVPPYASPSPYF